MSDTPTKTRKPLKYPFYPDLLQRFNYLQANIYCFLLARQVHNKKKRGRLSVVISRQTLAKILQLQNVGNISKAIKALREAKVIAIFRAKNAASKYVVASLDVALGRAEPATQDVRFQPSGSMQKQPLGSMQNRTLLDTTYLSGDAPNGAASPHTSLTPPIPPEGVAKETDGGSPASAKASAVAPPEGVQQISDDELRILREEAQREADEYVLQELTKMGINR